MQSIDLTKHTKRAIVKAAGKDTDTKISAVRVYNLLHKYLRLHCSTLVVIGGIGARGSLLNVCQYIFQNYGPNAFMSNENKCFIAVLANAVDILCGRDTAQRVRGTMSETCGKFCALKQLFSKMHELSIGLNVRRESKEDRREYMDYPCLWIAERKSGVWIVQVIQQNLADHCMTMVITIRSYRRITLVFNFFCPQISILE